MEQKEWEDLSKTMTVMAIASDLIGIFVPRENAYQRATSVLENRDQQALEVNYRMGQALVILEQLGYEIIKKL